MSIQELPEKQGIVSVGFSLLLFTIKWIKILTGIVQLFVTILSGKEAVNNNAFQN